MCLASVTGYYAYSNNFATYSKVENTRPLVLVPEVTVRFLHERNIVMTTVPETNVCTLPSTINTLGRPHKCEDGTVKKAITFNSAVFWQLLINALFSLFSFYWPYGFCRVFAENIRTKCDFISAKCEKTHSTRSSASIGDGIIIILPSVNLC